MIAQARITSDTSATVHLADEAVDVQGADLPEIRARVKQAFISAARDSDEAIDVVIVEPDVRHHLRVEPSGRITGRTPDQRPLYGPAHDRSEERRVGKEGRPRWRRWASRYNDYE